VKNCINTREPPTTQAKASSSETVTFNITVPFFLVEARMGSTLAHHTHSLGRAAPDVRWSHATNSLWALDACIASNACDFIELDLRYRASDGRVVCCHDADQVATACTFEEWFPSFLTLVYPSKI
jgi:glycerophosphoryl diester phosphodiesterase